LPLANADNSAAAYQRVRRYKAGYTPASGLDALRKNAAQMRAFARGASLHTGVSRRHFFSDSAGGFRDPAPDAWLATGA
jgi:hypothetical protein